MNIRFTSSLTAEDENVIAPVVLNALARILELVPLAYVIRIDTSDAQVYQHARPIRPRAPASAAVVDSEAAPPDSGVTDAQAFSK